MYEDIWENAYTGDVGPSQHASESRVQAAPATLEGAEVPIGPEVHVSIIDLFRLCISPSSWLPDCEDRYPKLALEALVLGYISQAL